MIEYRTCPRCNGTKFYAASVKIEHYFSDYLPPAWESKPCDVCQQTGEVTEEKYREYKINEKFV